MYCFYCWEQKLSPDPFYYMNLDENRKATIRAFAKYKYEKEKAESERMKKLNDMRR